MQSPLVSVVIATYNCGDYLEQAIQSVLDQTIGELEVIVVDDGSTDHTAAVVKQFVDPRLSYVWQANAGQTSAKNHGIRRARGTFVGFCDGDDYWYDHKLAVQLPLFERAGVGVVYSTSDVIDQAGNVIERALPELHRGELTERLFLNNFVPFGTALVRRECLDRLGAFDETLRMGIDWDLWLRLSIQYQFDFVPQATYAYRVWPGQMSNNWKGRYSSAFRIMDKFLEQHPGKISPGLKRRAFADTFANRARSQAGENPMSAISDAAKAVLLDPSRLYSWKTLARVLKESSSSQPTTENHVLLKKTLAPLVSRLTANVPRIFMYHRFSKKNQPRALGQEEFRQQLLLLKEHCEIVTMAELFERSRHKSSKPLAAVTVDDGYADFHEFAFPVLRGLGLKATVYVTTGFLDRKVYLWPDRIHALLDHCTAEKLRVEGFWQGIEVSLKTAADRDAAWNHLADQLVHVSIRVREQALEDLAAAVGVALDDLDMRNFPALSWDQVRELNAAGIEIGDHTYTHSCLAQLPDAEMRRELVSSKAMLEAQLGQRVRSFAYPNGSAQDYDARVLTQLKALEYDSAVVSFPRPLDHQRPYEIGRFSATCPMQEFRRLVEGFGIVRQWIDARK